MLTEVEEVKDLFDETAVLLFDLVFISCFLFVNKLEALKTQLDLSVYTIMIRIVRDRAIDKF